MAIGMLTGFNLKSQRYEPTPRAEASRARAARPGGCAGWWCDWLSPLHCCACLRSNEHLFVQLDGVFRSAAQLYSEPMVSAKVRPIKRRFCLAQTWQAGRNSAYHPLSHRCGRVCQTNRFEPRRVPSREDSSLPRLLAVCRIVQRVSTPPYLRPSLHERDIIGSWAIYSVWFSADHDVDLSSGWLAMGTTTGEGSIAISAMGGTA